ncbi:MAG: type IX secretion system membrane protein PorP/SprF [Bacteroidales bacterium]|nr:type IX secretion system membrane protein PorP/SprF [Bacteroidales bacterium]MCB9027586.1 type IX secretion system membrane protein PorP/SprF [Bacteroidales bacterium]HOO65397.1 type IX secretion system membrane protein PorP/SprF [Bacteroidales bacterium]HPE21750.1 type IX secretion system membrane protein PorP/SprF [Bacteroidales bacterium]HPJ04033.1 type IX secretion system membrane protein PorP/SprF [Bacteroidales bacterium]
MKFRIRTLASGLFLFMATLSGQDTWHGSLSGMHMMHNPGFAGVGGVQAVNISAFSFLPGNSFGLRSVHASYDGYFSAIHGGAGVWITDDMLGDILNDLKGGVSYSYHFRAGRRTYITAGLTASAISRGIRSGSVILPDDIDPFRGITGGGEGYAGPANVTRFDIGTGFTIASGPWYAGLSVMHLTRPALGDFDREDSRIHRLLTLTGGIELNPGGGDFFIRPSAAFLAQGDEYRIYLGGESTWKGLAAGVAMWHLTDGFTAVECSVGWDDAALKIILSYSYILAGGDVSFGGTAIIKAGVSFAFGNVEKSRALHIIKLPLL